MAATVRSPKLAPSASSSPGSKYYAGFSEGFVDDLIRHLELPESGVILDPWNGAGTTTTVATRAGRHARGYDINPVLVTVGKSRLLGADVVEGLDALTHQVLARAREVEVEVDDEPLSQWFTRGTATYLRGIERSVQAHLVTPAADAKMATPSGLDGMSSLSASFYVVLFETVRSFLSTYTSTNPTWFKVKPDERVSLGKDQIDARFRVVERRHHRHLLELTAWPQAGDGTGVIMLGNSRAIPLDDHTMDACITSPPYLTRIDYPVLTRPELAILGVGDGDLMRQMRDNTIGTTTVAKHKPAQSAEWGTYINEVLDKVKTHKSRASKTYYLSYYLQYYDSVYQSLAELRRVMKPKAPCALVVQDSYYKDLHIDLARGLAEMAASLGWTDVSRVDFRVPHRMANMNPAARQYRRGVSATESLLTLRQ